MRRIAQLLSTLVRSVPRLVVVAVLILTGVFAALSTQVQTASGNEGFAPDNPEIAAAERLSEHFGEAGEEIVQVLLEGSDVISADGLAAVEAIVSSVTASDAAAYLAEQPGRPATVSFLDPLRRTGAEPGALDDAAVDRLYVETLAQLPEEQAGLAVGLLPDDADPADAFADAGMLLVFLDTGDLSGGDAGAAFDRLIQIQSSVADAVRHADLPAGFRAEAFSFPLLFGDQEAFEAELARLFASAFAIIVVILGFVYWVRPGLGLRPLGASRRTVADVLVTMATIVMAVTWMNGMAALLGPGYLGVIGGLTEVTQIIPVLLIGLGVDYAIHLTSRYREEAARGASVPDSIARAVHTVGVALMLATVTTAVGFLTNIVNPVPALVDFGVLAAVGILSAFVLMLTFVPTVRLLLDRRAEQLDRLPRAALASTSERLLPGLMARTALLAERVPATTLAVGLLLGALGAYGLTQLETRFSSTDFVAADSPVVLTLDTITERFGGGFGETTQVLLTGDIATPAAHNALVSATERLADVPDVASYGGQAQAESPLSLVAGALLAGDGAPADPQLGAAMAVSGVGADLRVPGDGDVAGLYAALRAAAPEQAQRVLATGDDGVPLARVAVQTTAGEERAGQLRSDLDAAFAPLEAAGLEVTVTSNPIISDVIVGALQDSQVSSMAITLTAAMLLLAVTFWVRERRPLLGVITTLPVALVILWTFGTMAATGVPFGPVTATIAALAIGIGVPYSIHVTNRYLEDRAAQPDPAAAIRLTVRHTGGALAGSALTTCAGFGILITSSLTPFRQFGLVTVYAIGFSLLAATLVLPSMLTLWDRWHRRARGGRHAAQRARRPAPTPA